MIEAEAARPISFGARATFNYVHSPLFDWTFFLAPFWASLLYLGLITAFPAHVALIFVLSYIVLAETHFASTWTIYLDPDNRREYRARQSVYYWVPLGIMAGCVLLAWAVSLKVTLLFGALVSGVHVTRQSTGIVALYRAKARQLEPAHKRWENLTLYLASGTFLAIGFRRFYVGPSSSFGVLSQAFHPLIPLLDAGIAALALGALFSVGRVVLLEARRVQENKELSASKLVALGYSVFLYSPYLFATRMEDAVAIGVGIHYVQYLGIVWLLNKNKYTVGTVAGPRPTLDRRVLGWLSQKLWVRWPYLLFYAAVMAYLRQGGFRWDTLAPASWLYSIPIGLQVVHYHLDAFIWRFSNPYIRANVLPYLRRIEAPGD